MKKILPCLGPSIPPYNGYFELQRMRNLTFLDEGGSQTCASSLSLNGSVSDFSRLPDFFVIPRFSRDLSRAGSSSALTIGGFPGVATIWISPSSISNKKNTLRDFSSPFSFPIVVSPPHFGAEAVQENPPPFLRGPNIFSFKKVVRERMTRRGRATESGKVPLL